MKYPLPFMSKWLFIIPLFVLSIAALACASLVPSPVQSLPTPTNEIPTLPTVDPSIGSTEVEPTRLVEPTTPPKVEIPSVLGEDIPIAGANHIEEGTTATDWNSDPPTSGEHYGQWATAGFYDEAIPDGYLVHDMEHGYVIIYYNCELVDMDCEAYKTAIEAAMAATGNDPNTNSVKLIAVPRPGMDNPITYASWGHLYKAEAFVSEELVLYVQLYRSNPDYAPEWSLP